MAASGKKSKKKSNWKPLQLDEAANVTAPRKPVPTANWADEVESSMINDGYEPTYKPGISLPTAPRASRANDIDESKIPNFPPYQVHLTNMPYDLPEEDLIDFFENLKIKSIQMPSDRNRNRAYVEFEDRPSLIMALNKNGSMLKTRPINIELPNERGMNRGRGGRDREDRGGGRSDMGSSGPDRTAGNWRSGPRTDEQEDRSGSFDRSSSYNRRDGGFSGGGGGGGGGGFGRNFDRDDRGGFNRDDRGGGGFERDRYREDRGYDRDRGSFNRDDSGRGFNRGDNRGDDRGYGDRGSYRGRDDDRGRDENRQWREESRGSGFSSSKFEDRRDRDHRYPRREERRDGPPPERGNSAEPKTRPVLKLLPKSVTAPAPDAAAVVAPVSIFGGAKPVDTAAREREIEERLMKGEDPSEPKIRSGPGSTGSGSQKEVEIERRVEPAPPPKENPWSRKPTSPVVNNGRSTPDESTPSIDEHSKIDSKDVGSSEPKRTEPKKNDEPKGRGPKPAAAIDKPKPKEDKHAPKLKEPKKEKADDIAKMPKVQEGKVPNFEGSNKFSTLLDTDDPAE